MLSRAARHKLRRQTHTPVAEVLALPWLCPAQMRWTARTASRALQSRTLHDARQPHRRTPSALPSRHESRSLATATDPSTLPSGALPYHEIVGQAWGATRRQDPEMSKLEAWDTSRPLVVHDTMSSIGIPVSVVKYGIGGDPVELHQNLYACLRVGRLERASAILQRLTDMYSPAAPEVVDAHNIFLQAKLELCEQSPSKQAMQELEDWYDAKMVRKGILPNSQTLVTLLRASMIFLQGRQQEVVIRKYLDMAQECGPNVLNDVNGSPDFSDEEWDILIRLQGDSFNEPPSVNTVQGLHLSTPGGKRLAIEHGLLPDPALVVKSVEQKGMGLSSLKKALTIFETGQDVPYPHEMEGTPEDKDRAYNYMRQLRIEQDATMAATERWKVEDAKLQEIGIHGVLQSKPIQALMWNWYAALLPRLEAECKKVKEVLSKPTEENRGDDRHVYGPYLEGLSPQRLASMSLTRLLSSYARRSEENVLKVTALTLTLGKDLENDFNESAKTRHQTLLHKLRRKTRLELLTKLAKEKETGAAVPLASTPPPKNVESNTYMQKDFPIHIKVKLGALLLDNIMQTATVTLTREDPKTGLPLKSTQPAFHHHSGFSQGKKTAMIVPHHEVITKLRNEPVGNIHTVKLPMLTEPKPWVGFSEGGYYTIRDQAVRTRTADSSQKAYAISAIENGDMEKVLAGLDVLGKVPWQVNRDVFAVMAETWNRGEGIGGLVSENSDLQRPVEPAADAPIQERSRYARERKLYENEVGGLHSQRCFQNFQLEVARSFLNERFYYPHSVDFRGRAYPIPPVLNHIGADFSRGLLLFANGKELGEVGLQWLKVHLANLYGYDKANLKDREQFAMDNIEHIYDSADNPLSGNRWWTKADDPWQCLACCFELAKALRSPEPTRFLSHLPVHQDGTCNGLQHYAALGGDEAGASQVNLEPSDKPQDIYTGVADMVREMVAEEARQDPPNPNAVIMDGKISRSVVKRTVMTNVYGVTFMGAKLQVLDELKDVFPNFKPVEGVPDLNMPALYIAKKIFIALGRIFNGAQEIQCWLGECGDRITTSLSIDQIRRIQQRLAGKELTPDPKYSKKKKVSPREKKKLDADTESFKTGIIWTTPLKMPVVQPYRKDHLRKVKTSLGSISVAIASSSDIVNKRKQLQAFPPNFIHSLDATHMTLSALKCSELGLDFAAVHDSFWTHAADIPTLNIVIRDAFVRMHSEDIIGRLAAEFKARYEGAYYRASLDHGSPVVQEIIEWRKAQHLAEGRKKGSQCRSASSAEVALEVQRQDLLKSEDPEERKKGEQMITPTSIWLKYRDPSSLASPRLALLGDVGGPSNGTGPEKIEIQGAVLNAEGESSLYDIEKQVFNPEAEEDEAVEELDGDADIEEGVEVKKTKPTLERGKRTDQFSVWLPLTFPPVPKKGNWDVQRLRESKYFFS